MRSTRMFVILSVAVLVGFLILTASHALQNGRRIRQFIYEHELPSIGLAVAANLDRTAAKYHRVGEELLRDGFLRDWILDGEQNEQELRAFMEETRARHNMLDASIVSDRTETYYGTDGRTLRLSPRNWERDGWYYSYRELMPESNIDAWYYPETGEIGMWVNVPIRDLDGRFLGVTGGGIDATEFSETMHSYDDHPGIVVYMARPDGQLVYATDRSLLAQPVKHLDELWDGAMIPRLQRSELGSQGVVIRPEGSRGPMLWLRYMQPWDTYLIVEHTPERLTARTWNEMLRTLLTSGLLATSLYAIALITILRARRKIAVQAAELEDKNRQLNHLAGTDMLTGLYNRLRFTELVGQELARVERTGEESSLVILDLDYFKDVNDRYGHPNGDLVLCETAEIVRDQIRKTDTLARFGGEEFSVLLPGTSAEGARQVAEKIRQAIEQHRFSGAMQDLRMTASFGIAQLAAHEGISFDSAYQEADEALYRAKRNGRNQVGHPQYVPA